MYSYFSLTHGERPYIFTAGTVLMVTDPACVPWCEAGGSLLDGDQQVCCRWYAFSDHRVTVPVQKLRAPDTVTVERSFTEDFADSEVGGPQLGEWRWTVKSTSGLSES